MQKVKYNFAEARLRANKYLPYLRVHFMSLIPVPSDKLPTMAVDEHGRCYYNPAVFDKWTMEEAAGVVLHEDLHIVLDHVKRFKNYVGENHNPMMLYIWNLAVDCVVNQILEGANVPLPEDRVTIESLKLPKNLTAEEYYDLLMQKVDKAVKEGRVKPTGSGDGNGEGIPVPIPGQKPGDAPEDMPEAPQWGGSGADGEKREWEHGAPHKDAGGKPCDKDGNPAPEGMSKADKDLLQRAAAEDIKKHESSAPGNQSYLQKFADQVLEPKVDPAREIQAKVKYAAACTHGHGNYTWQKLNRRVPPGAMRLPCNIQPVPQFTLIADTSGSMGAEDRGLSLGVVGNILRSYPAQSVTVLAGDVSCKEVSKVFRPEQVQLVGGGGTDMGALVLEAVKVKPKPDVIIVCTDGETPWPEAPVNAHVVACLTRRPSYCSEPPAWIQTIYLEG